MRVEGRGGSNPALLGSNFMLILYTILYSDYPLTSVRDSVNMDIVKQGSCGR